MDKDRKKHRKRRWREGQRAEARAALPLPFEELKVMFDMLDAALARHGCDHTRRLTRSGLRVAAMTPNTSSPGSMSTEAFATARYWPTSSDTLTTRCKGVGQAQSLVDTRGLHLCGLHPF